MERQPQERKTPTNRVARFTSVPPTIPVGVSSPCVWTVTQTVAGAPVNVSNQAASFSVMPTAGVVIDSATDAAGNVVASGGTTADGTTDAGGTITVMVTINYVGQASITGKDGATGAIDTAMITGV